MRCQFTSGFVALAILFAGVPALAEAPRLHVSGAAAHAVGGHQQREFGWGVAVLPAVEYPLTRALGLELELGALWLSEGEPPENSNFVAEGDGTALSAAVGARLRPFATAHDGTRLSPAGFWLAGNFGLTSTNELVRPMIDAQVGYDFLDSRGRAGLGPMFALYHVFQPDDELRPADANVLLFGVHALFDFSEGIRQRFDRDRDGLYDDEDRCPDHPEDRDGFEDTDGCPDLDDDRDAVPDTRDECPRVPEDKDGFQDLDGCPDDDNDKDGVPDAKDKCPMVPEDKDHFEDEDGCPDEDNDKDGIPDIADLCPFEAETVNDYADTDGCPDEDQVRVVGDKIVLDDRVHFMVNSHIIRRQSFGLLERLGKLIGEHPEYIHISIEGHADERGPDSFNLPLSERRAAAVMEFLIKAGIPRERLSSKGYGEAQPRSERKTEFGYYQNRRVEFIITRETRGPGSKTTTVAPPAPPPLGSDGPPPPEVPTPPAPQAPPAAPQAPLPAPPAPKPAPPAPAPQPGGANPTPPGPAPAAPKGGQP